MANKVLFVAVHPDDETLAFGGTILKHKKNGDQIYWLIVTNISERDGWDKETVKNRQIEIGKVEELYGFNKTVKLGFPTTKLDLVNDSDFISSISKEINEIQPNILYLPFVNDVHSDHRIAFNAVYSCTKSFRYPFIRKIMMGETLSETEFAPSINGLTFVPNVFVDITEFMEMKKEIMNVYKSEVMEGNMPRSISAINSLSRYRGSRIGKEYAEAFMLLFENL